MIAEAYRVLNETFPRSFPLWLRALESVLSNADAVHSVERCYPVPRRRQGISRLAHAQISPVVDRSNLPREEEERNQKHYILSIGETASRQLRYKRDRYLPHE